MPKIHPDISTILEVISEYSGKSNILEEIAEIIRPVQIFLDGEAENFGLAPKYWGQCKVLIDGPGITTTHVGFTQRNN